MTMAKLYFYPHITNIRQRKKRKAFLNRSMYVINLKKINAGF